MKTRHKLLLILLLMLVLPSLSYFVLFAASVKDFSLFSTGKKADVPLPPSVESVKDANGIEFILIPAGTFTIGTVFTADVNPDEVPQQSVTISRPFYLSRYEVTQAQWESIMEKNPSEFVGEEHPVDSVSWEAVQTFIGKLNEKAGTKRYRLPTEAEWEYAARAGTETVRYWGDSADEMDQYAWYEDNSGKQSRPVGRLKPNAWGLHDMLGNVWEWCQNWYSIKPYTSEPVTDPQGPSEGVSKVVRGGSWSNYASLVRAAYRFELNPTYRRRNIGLRLLMEKDP